MVFATLYVFGLKPGVGAETLSQFFKMIRIDSYVGISPSALRTQMQKMEELLPQFQDACEKNLSKPPHKIVAGLDETFFGDFIILVLMDLRSGYLLLEDITEDRCFDTWYKKTTPRLEKLGLEVNHVISDRAKALIKMVVSGFKCESGADVFHAQQDASRWLGARIGKRLATAEKKLAKAQENRAEYQGNLQGIAEEVHPFPLMDNRLNDTKKIELGLENRVQAFEKIAQEQGIQDNKKVMKKLRNQFKPLAVSVSFWWAWVFETLQNLTSDDLELKQWLTTTLLPVVYWHHKWAQTKNRKVKEKYRQAWGLALDAFKAHPLMYSLT